MDALVQGTAHMAGHAWHGTSNWAQEDLEGLLLTGALPDSALKVAFDQ